MPDQVGPNDELFWLAYCDIIKKQIGQLNTTSDTTGNAIFYGTKALRGPPVECDVSFVNYGYYTFGNNLLNPTNLFFTPSATNTYIDALKSYLSWVDVGADGSDLQKLNVINTKEAYDAAHGQLIKVAKKAHEDFVDMSNMGMVPAGQTFADWLVVNSTSYNNALVADSSTAGAYKSAMLSLNGPLSGQWNTQMDNIMQATTSLAVQLPSGLNMPTDGDAPPSINDIFIAKTGGKALPIPTNFVYYPTYTCPNYATIVKTWEGVATQAPKKTYSFQISIDNGKNVSKSQFGQTKIGGNFGFTYEGVIGFGLRGDSTTTTETLDTSSAASDITITMFWDDMKRATISPGSWNISNPRGNYPKLKDGAPDSVKTLVRASELVLVSKLGYTVQLSNNAKREFNEKITKARSGGGYVSFFGVPINIGANVSDNSVQTTHDGAWHNDTGIFEVTPTADAGFATVIAVVGEKIQTF